MMNLMNLMNLQKILRVYMYKVKMDFTNVAFICKTANEFNSLIKHIRLKYGEMDEKEGDLRFRQGKYADLFFYHSLYGWGFWYLVPDSADTNYITMTFPQFLEFKENHQEYFI